MTMNIILLNIIIFVGSARNNRSELIYVHTRYALLKTVLMNWPS